MSVDPRHVLSVLFESLGIGPPPAQPADPEVFEVDDARCAVSRAPSGTEVLLSIEIGALTRDPYTAADHLRRLLGTCLGLAIVNRAALVCDNPPDDATLRAAQSGRDMPALRFSAIARIDSARPSDIITALQDILQLRTAALSYLQRDDVSLPDEAASRPAAEYPHPRDEDGSAFLIFQP